MIYSHLSRLFRFAIVGCVATAVYTGLYVILVETVRPSVLLTTVIAYCCAMVASFLGHKYVTFRAKGDIVGQSVRYAIVYLAGLALAYFIINCITWLAFWLSMLRCPCLA
jgi:putative flippase GtrA